MIHADFTQQHVDTLPAEVAARLRKDGGAARFAFFDAERLGEPVAGIGHSAMMILALTRWPRAQHHLVPKVGVTAAVNPLSSVSVTGSPFHESISLHLVRYFDALCKLTNTSALLLARRTACSLPFTIGYLTG